MQTSAMWNRRQVLQGAGSLTAMSSLSALTGNTIPLAERPLQQQFAYIGSHETGGSIHVFAVDGERWTPVQTVTSACPATMAFHPNKRILYVANEIATWHGLPCGSVEAFAIDAHAGSLTGLSQQPLALSATLPRGLAVSPDGRHLVVAVYGGGAYNVLPIAEDGSLGRVAAIVKETGAGPHPVHQQSAHPHTMLFHGDGRHILATDAGSDLLSTFQLADGALERVEQSSMPAGSGPAAMAMHPSGEILLVAHQWSSSIRSFAWDGARGAVGQQLDLVTVSSGIGGTSPLAITVHPTGRFLYASGSQTGIRGWTVEATTGRLSSIDMRHETIGSPNALAISADGRALFALVEERGQVLQMRIDPVSGQLHRSQSVATVPSARSLLIQPRTGVSV